jgi:hypothetical protein
MRRWYGPDAITAQLTWPILQWASRIGADEFSYECLGGRTPRPVRCEQVETVLLPFHKGHQHRPTLTMRATDVGARLVPLWRLDQMSLAIMRDLIWPDGILADHQGEDAGWLEDLTIYRRGELLLGAITHEHTLAIEASDEEFAALRAGGLPL